MKTHTIAEAITALATIQSATGRIVDGNPAKGDTEATLPHVELTITTEHFGPLVMTLDRFDDIYRGMVNCWPVVKPLKNELAVKVREASAAERERKKQADKSAKETEAAKKKQEREEAIAKKQAEKDAAVKAKANEKAAKEKAAKDKADKEAAEAKKKAATEAKAGAKTAAKK